MKMVLVLNNNVTGEWSDNTSKEILYLFKFIENTNNNLDDFFMYVNGVLVLLMQVGFACLEAGSIRSKNVTNIMLKNFLDSLICSIMFWLTGYAIAFGNGNQYIGWTWFACDNLPQRKWSEWFFQYTFASTASTLVSGAVAERSSFVAYLCYSVFMSGIIYPVAVHWTWANQGWLKNLGFVDFAGGMLIHGLAGGACLIATIILGPRNGRFESKNYHEITGHSTALIGTGAIIILVGFCGFNAGTMNHFSQPNDGVLAIIITRNTLLCAAAGALTILITCKIGFFDEICWPFSHTVNGGISGLVSSCGGCDQFTPPEAIITGIIGSIIYMSLHNVILFYKIDDPLNSSPIHLGCGIWSVLAIPFIARKGIIALPLKTFLREFLFQVIGVFSILIWSALTSAFLFGLLQVFGLFRSSEKEELIGMDVSKHREPAYAEQYKVSEGEQRNEYSHGPSTNRQVSVLCATSL